MEKIDFLKKGITDFFPNFFITFSKVQRNIFNEKSHSDRKTNLKVDLVSCEGGPEGVFFWLGTLALKPYQARCTTWLEALRV